MKNTILLTLLISLFAPIAAAQTVANPMSNPLTGHHRKVYSVMQMMLLRSAEKMPEEEYGFRPAESVRSFGQIVGHVADSQYFFCSTVLGEKNASLRIEKTRTTKAELIAALTEAFAYCNSAYGRMTDAIGVEMTQLMGGETPKLGVLATNNLHTMEHYGNLVTYLRINNIVPPTSEPDFMANAMKK